MKGEIDWIVMKALEKDRTRRYKTANGFAADIQRYLTGEQVQAVPPSFGYRLQKAYRRNKTVMQVGGALFALLIGAAVIGTALAVRATRAEALAEAKRIEAEENAKEAKHQSELYSQAVLEELEARVDLEEQLISLRLDRDLAELTTDPRVGLLRLARPHNKLFTAEFDVLNSKMKAQMQLGLSGDHGVPLTEFRNPIFNGVASIVEGRFITREKKILPEITFDEKTETYRTNTYRWGVYASTRNSAKKTTHVSFTASGLGHREAVTN